MHSRALARLVVGALAATGAVTLAVHLADDRRPAVDVVASDRALVRSGGASATTVHGAPQVLAQSLTTAPGATPGTTAADGPTPVPTDDLRAVVPGGEHLGPMHTDPLPPDVRPGGPVDLDTLYARAGLDREALAEAPATAEATLPPGTPTTKGLTKHLQPSCSGNGTDGNRVQVLFVRESGQASSYTDVLPLLLNEVANVDDVFGVSAQQTGGVRRVRWVHEDCVPVIPEVVVPAGALSSFDATIDAVADRGYKRADRKYLMFADARLLCGIGTYYEDTRTSGNANDGRYASYARVDRDCWSSGYHSTAAHELVHNLGGVLESAPNATVYGHCTDEADLMCYVDGPDVKMRSVCGAAQEQLLDCRHDDYFHTAPAAGSYLATSWNTARSTFLDSTVVQDPLTVSVQPSTSTAETGDLVTLTATSDGASSYVWSTTASACTLSGAASATATARCPSTVTGPVSVRLRVADASGRTAEAETILQMVRAAAPTATVTAPGVVTEGSSLSVVATVSGKPTLGYRWSASGGCTLSSATAPAPVATCPAGSAGTSTAFGLTLTQGDGQQVVAEPVTVAVVASGEPQGPSPAPVEWSLPTVTGGPQPEVAAVLTEALSGAAVPGTSVDLQRRAAGGSWTTVVAGLSSDPDGTVVVPVQRTGPSWYRFVVSDPSRPGDATASAEVLVHGVSRVTAAWKAAQRAVVGRIVDGDGAPVAGARLVLQRKVAGSWTPVTTAVSGGDGRVSVRRRPSSTTYFRWVFRGSDLLRGDRSPAVGAR